MKLFETMTNHRTELFQCFVTTTRAVNVGVYLIIKDAGSRCKIDAFLDEALIDLLVFGIVDVSIRKGTSYEQTII